MIIFNGITKSVTGRMAVAGMGIIMKNVVFPASGYMIGIGGEGRQQGKEGISQEKP